MPRHLASGINSQAGKIAFNNTKTMNITFLKSFTTVPSVMLTLGDSGNNPAYKYSVTKTGFTIGFSNKFTGEVSWEAKE